MVAPLFMYVANVRQLLAHLMLICKENKNSNFINCFFKYRRLQFICSLIFQTFLSFFFFNLGHILSCCNVTCTYLLLLLCFLLLRLRFIPSWKLEFQAPLKAVRIDSRALIFLEVSDNRYKLIVYLEIITDFLKDDGHKSSCSPSSSSILLLSIKYSLISWPNMVFTGYCFICRLINKGNHIIEASPCTEYGRSFGSSLFSTTVICIPSQKSCFLCTFC